VLALDVPSGLELATGALYDPHVQAEATLTLAVPKEPLRAPGAAAARGELFLPTSLCPSARTSSWASRTDRPLAPPLSFASG
jgi:NAD(P)H-hydrate epimerase